MRTNGDRQADVIKLIVALRNSEDAPKKTKYFVLEILFLCNTSNLLMKWKKGFNIALTG